MEKIEVKVDSREILGKKVKQLRARGITPVHVIGHGIESMSLQCETLDLKQVLSRAGKTHLVNLKIDQERQARPALVREVQINPISRQILHVDFYQVRMEERVRMEVPVVVVGESPLMKQKDTMLEHEMNTLTLECLPADIPESLAVDVSVLIEMGQAIRVRDVVVPDNVDVINDGDQPVLKIAQQRRAMVEEEEEEAAAAAAAVAAGAEGGAEAAGEAGTESSGGDSE